MTTVRSAVNGMLTKAVIRILSVVEREEELCDVGVEVAPVEKLLVDIGRIVAVMVDDMFGIIIVLVGTI